MDKWDGFSPLWDFGLIKSDLKVYLDASGSWGCVTYQDPQWLQLCWVSCLYHLSISMKEPIPVVLAAVLFNNQWASEVVQFVVDNKVVVDVLNATFCIDTDNVPYSVTGFFAAKI